MTRIINAKSKRSKSILILSLMILHLTSCSGSSNIKSEWDCPKPKGFGCIDIAQADELALEKLAIKKLAHEEKVYKANDVHIKEINEIEEKNKNKKNQKEELDHKIWFAPYTDKLGYFHEPHVISYKGAK